MRKIVLFWRNIAQQKKNMKYIFLSKLMEQLFMVCNTTFTLLAFYIFYS